jgi:hypothetical protein
MDSLFSHAFEPEAPRTAEPAPASALEQAQRNLSLPLALEQAAEAFVDYLHLWWPAPSVLGARAAAGAHLWWDADGFGAELEDGRALTLGECTEWSWPHGAAVTFVEGPAAGSSLAVALSETPAGTALTLSGPPSLIDAVGDSFSRFMGI